MMAGTTEAEMCPAVCCCCCCSWRRQASVPSSPLEGEACLAVVVVVIGEEESGTFGLVWFGLVGRTGETLASSSTQRLLGKLVASAWASDKTKQLGRRRRTGRQTKLLSSSVRLMVGPRTSLLFSSEKTDRPGNYRYYCERVAAAAAAAPLTGQVRPIWAR